MAGFKKETRKHLNMETSIKSHSSVSHSSISMLSVSGLVLPRISARDREVFDKVKELLFKAVAGR